MKKHLVVYLDPSQSDWLDEKAAQGYKKAVLIRFLISECMSRKESWDNPVGLKRLRPKGDGPWLDSEGRVRNEPAGEPEREADWKPGERAIPKKKPLKKRGRPRKIPSLPVVANPDPANKRDVVAEVIAFFYDHPGEELTEELKAMTLEYHMEQWRKRRAGVDCL